MPCPHGLIPKPKRLSCSIPSVRNANFCPKALFLGLSNVANQMGS
jgi:hypothetical protein